MIARLLIILITVHLPAFLIYAGNEESSLREQLQELNTGKKKSTVYLKLCKELVSLESAQAASVCDTAIKLSEKYNKYLQVFEGHLFLGIAFNQTGSYDSALYYLKKGLNRAEGVYGMQHISEFYLEIGKSYNHKGNVTEALVHWKKGIPYFKNNLDSTGMGKTLQLIGNTYQSIGDFPEALEYYLKAINWSPLNDQRNHFELLNNIGLIYKEQNDLEQAKSYFIDAMNVVVTNNLKEPRAVILNNLGHTYTAEKNYAKALGYYYQSLNVEKTRKNENGIAVCLHNIAIVHIYQKAFGQALDNLKRSLGIYKKTGNKFGTANVLSDIGNIYLKQGKLNDALDYFERSSIIRSSIGDLEGLQKNYYNLAIAYKEKEDHKNALNYFEKYTALKERLFNENKIKKLSNLQYQYEIQRKEQQIVLQDQKISLLEKDKLIQVYSISGLVILMLLLSLTGWQIYRNQQLSIRLKDRDLTDFAMDIIKKNETLEEVNDQLALLRKKGSTDESLRERISSLTHKVQTNINLEHERKVFNMRVKEQNQRFFEEISKRYSFLTDKDKQLAAMIKLNLTSKEIAGLQNIETKSVEMSRYRLRKKLKLDQNITLSEFFDRI